MPKNIDPTKPPKDYNDAISRVDWDERMSAYNKNFKKYLGSRLGMMSFDYRDGGAFFAKFLRKCVGIFCRNLIFVAHHRRIIGGIFV
jgi:hypothetical protein